MNKKSCGTIWERTEYITSLCELKVKRNWEKLNREDKDFYNRIFQFLRKLENQVKSHDKLTIDPIQYLFDLYNQWKESVSEKLIELWVKINTNLLNKYYKTFWWEQDWTIGEKEKDNNEKIKTKVKDILKWTKKTNLQDQIKSNESNNSWDIIINILSNHWILEEKNIRGLASFVNLLKEEGLNLKIITKIVNELIKHLNPESTFNIWYDELKEILIKYEKKRAKLPFNTWTKRINSVLKAILDWKVHIQSSENERLNNNYILETVNQIKLQILWVIEIDSNEKELKKLVREYFQNKTNKWELRKIWIKIIRLLYRIKCSYNKDKRELKKVQFSDNISSLIWKHYKTEVNWNLIEALLIEKLLMISEDDGKVEVVVTPDILDHKKIDFILKIRWKDNDLKIWTQVTFTNGKHLHSKKIEVENLAYEVDKPDSINNNEEKHYNMINLWDISPRINPDITSFVSIETSLWRKIQWKRWQKLRNNLIWSFEKSKIWYLDESLWEKESEKLATISLWYILASKEVSNFMENWTYNKKVNIPNTDYEVNISCFKKDDSSINVSISNGNWHILARISFFITQKSLNKYWNTKNIKKRTLKSKRNNRNTKYVKKTKK